MNPLTTSSDTLREAYDRLRAAAPHAPAWLESLRERGWARYQALGAPHGKLESWRFTNPAPLTQTAFESAYDAGAAVGLDELAPFRFGGIGGMRLVFVDGLYQPDLSELDGLPDGVTVASLSEAIAGDPDLVEAHLGRVADPDDDPETDAFAALNLALAADGLLVHVPEGVTIERPIHLMCLSTRAERPRMTHLRHVVAAEARTDVTIIENHASLGAGTCWSNGVSEISAGEGARVRHYRLDRYNESTYHVGTLRVRQQARSRFDSHAVLLGGALVRNNIQAELVGVDAEALLNGLYLPHGRQHVDTRIRVTHAAEHCRSRQSYRGILDDQSHGVFAGRIVVAEGAQKTDAEQSIKNLLLSDDAQTDSMPQLEIYADDVRCTHGSTTGQIDPDALFYLRARGVDETTARGLLLWAFAHESLEPMSVAPIRAKLEESLLSRLPHGDILATLIDTASGS